MKEPSATARAALAAVLLVPATILAQPPPPWAAKESKVRMKGEDEQQWFVHSATTPAVYRPGSPDDDAKVVLIIECAGGVSFWFDKPLSRDGGVYGTADARLRFDDTSMEEITVQVWEEAPNVLWATGEVGRKIRQRVIEHDRVLVELPWPHLAPGGLFPLPWELEGSGPIWEVDTRGSKAAYTSTCAEAERQALREQEELRALLDAGRVEYIARIKDRIERNWLRPPGTEQGLKCVVRVSQIPGGEVVEVEIRTSSGSGTFDRSVEEAVLRASPLPVPKDPSLFQRQLIITFEPEA